MQSTVPSSDATIDPLTETATLTFDKKVTVADLAKITLNGLPLTEYEEGEDGMSVILQLGDLEEAASYALSIPKGAIKGIPGVLNAEDIVVRFTTSGALEIEKNLVMPNASAQAKNVYAFLSENYRKKIISGTMAKVDWNTEDADRVYGWTGKYPAMNTFDFISHYGHWTNYNDISVVENWWNKNGLVSIMWHWNVPQSAGNSNMAFYYTGKGGGSPETSFDITLAVQDGTAENTIVKNDLNTIADYLLALQAKNIPVIWRPLHEASGGWFWWGGKGPDACKQLWIMMFETFKAKGINNLIWVWTTQIGDSDWYPGDAYVDIIGRDIYDKTDAVGLYQEYRDIRKAYPHKIVALSECGNVAGITEQWEAQAKWSWFMPWYDSSASGDLHRHADKEFWISAFANDYVISREDMPNLAQ